jgi:two-component system, OmpR family, sensor histidine kinase KdpD
MLLKAWRFAASLIAVMAVIVVYRLLLPVNSTTVALTLLLVILGISAQWGLAEATAASVLAVLGFNFYFLPPVGTLTIQDPQNWVALLAFLVTAVTASQLSARARRRAEADEARRLEIERLYALVQAMSLTGSVRKTIREFVHRVVQVFGCEAAALYYKPTGEVFRSGPESAPASDHDLAVAAEIENASIDSDRGVATAPVRLGVRTLGSLALAGKLPSAEMVRAIADMVAITIEKARAIEDASHAEAARQGEVLKAALLDSLAHDIRTPLTSIKAAVTTLLGAEPAAGLPRELLDIINQGADRLNQLAAEVIAMARIEAGKLHLDKKAVAVDDLIAGALAELAPAARGREIAVEVPDDLPRAEVDVELAREVVKQFLENALKYSPEDAAVRVTAAVKSGKIVIGVADRGPGIEENERALIFDKFFRGRRHRFSTKGTGMGLAIAKGIAEAHGERIWVESEPGQGAAFYMSLAPAPSNVESRQQISSGRGFGGNET